jgi:hypothetical protein
MKTMELNLNELAEINGGRVAPSYQVQGLCSVEEDTDIQDLGDNTSMGILKSREGGRTVGAGQIIEVLED